MRAHNFALILATIALISFQNCSNANFEVPGTDARQKADDGFDDPSDDSSQPDTDDLPPIDLGNVMFILIDEDSIDNGSAPNRFDGEDVNDDIAEIGVREPLRYFEQHEGQVISLSMGQSGDEGMFYLTSIPDSWKQAGPTGDGLSNLLLAGPGLGKPNQNGDREALLDGVPSLPLPISRQQDLVGRTVCGLVFDSDISFDRGKAVSSLKGANLGIVAFEITRAGDPTDGSPASNLEVRIRDAGAVCLGAAD